MEHEITFEALDRLLGDHAPFLVSLSDGPDNLPMVLGIQVLGNTTAFTHRTM